MGAAPGAGWEEGEFEFKLVFEEDPPPQQQSQGPSPARTAEPESSVPAEESVHLDPSNSSSLGETHFLGIVSYVKVKGQCGF